MTPADLQRELLAALGDIAPEVDAATLDPARPLRQQIDLDSADWLEFLVAVHQRLGVAIPDAEAGRLRTLDQIAAFCQARLPGAGQGGGSGGNG